MYKHHISLVTAVKYNCGFPTVINIYALYIWMCVSESVFVYMTRLTQKNMSIYIYASAYAQEKLLLHLQMVVNCEHVCVYNYKRLVEHYQTNLQIRIHTLRYYSSGI